MTQQSRYDLAIIGGGPGGHDAAIHAANAGLSVALIDDGERLGGVCLNRGCIPTKSLLRSAEAFMLAGEGDEYGFATPPILADFDRIMTRSREVPVTIARGLDSLMNAHRITVIRGRGVLAGDGQIRVTTADGSQQTITATDIILAVGAHPKTIPGIEPDGARVLTSDHVWELDTLPKSILIIGAGAIGVQFASFFSTFGTVVTLVEMAGQLLPGIDVEVARRLASLFKRRGMTLKTGTMVDSLEVTDSGCRAQLSDGICIETELVLVAAGYTGNMDGSGLDVAGVAHDQGFITVSDDFRTSAPHVSAIGDCIGPPMLAHAASEEGRRAVETILGMSANRLDPDLVPIAIYSHPQVASVGLSESAARKQGHDIATGVRHFKAIGKAVAIGETDGFAKVIIERGTNRILGAHIVGPDADESLQELVLAMHAGIPADAVANAIHAHPTLVEAVRDAVRAALG